jgi:alkylation response protein AidB-like acyl-CoA dehydrogenase
VPAVERARRRLGPGRCRPPSATATGDFVLNGQKVWTSGAHYSQFGSGHLPQNPDVPKHKGITCLIVDMATPGIDGPAAAADDRRRALQRGVLRRRPRPGRANVVGEVDGGWGVARTTMMNERFAASGMNSPSQAFPRLIALARTGAATRRGRGEDGTVRQHLAELYIRARLFDLTTARVRTALSQGTMPGHGELRC